MNVKKINVVPYNSSWPQMFEKEASCIRESLKDNLIALHHVGSTSVPGLDAKPTLDMIIVIKDRVKVIPQLESLGFCYKGSFHIPLRLYFNDHSSRTTGMDLNIHVYEEGHPEIDLNLCFRDFLRLHPFDRDRYSALKHEIIKDPTHYIKDESGFTKYTLGKDRFIQEILQKAGWKGLRVMKCLHYRERAFVNRVRQKFFSQKGEFAPEVVFYHPNDTHMVLIQGVECVGYAHIELSQNNAILQIIAIKQQDQKIEDYFLAFLKKWIQMKGYEDLLINSYLHDVY